MDKKKTLPAVVTAEIAPEQVLTKEYVMEQLIKLFSALEDATGDAGTATLVIEKITEAVAADPAFSKQILTPENISKALELKKKSDAGNIKITDITTAYPAIAKHFPFVSMLDKMKMF